MAPEIKKASVETDALKCVQPVRLWQGLTGWAVGWTTSWAAVGAIAAFAVVTTETTTTAAMMAATATTIAVVEAALFAAVTLLIGVRAALILAFWAGTELRTTVATAIIATITAATASAAATAAATIVLAAAISTAVAAFVTTTFAAVTLVLALGRSCWSLLGGVTTEEVLQPAEEARFLGFDDCGCGFRFERALFATSAELFFALAGLFAAGFAGAKLVARFLWLLAAGWTIGVASLLAVFMPLWAEVRAAFAARAGAGGRLFRLAADFPALG